MTLQEAIAVRHSVRAYTERPLEDEAVRQLQQRIEELNSDGLLHAQLVCGEPKAFSGRLARYGRFRNVRNYIVMAGRRGDDLDERIGYRGELLVLLAQTMGLNTCWVGLSYSKVPGTYALADDEAIGAYIAIGYGQTQGVTHRIKSVAQVSNADDRTLQWFRRGVEAALLAPTAINQQRFHFDYLGQQDGRHCVRARRGRSLVGFSQLDLGIAKCHFEIAAGRNNFDWV